MTQKTMPFEDAKAKAIENAPAIVYYDSELGAYGWYPHREWRKGGIGGWVHPFEIRFDTEDPDDLDYLALLKCDEP